MMRQQRAGRGAGRALAAFFVAAAALAQAQTTEPALLSPPAPVVSPAAVPAPVVAPVAPAVATAVGAAPVVLPADTLRRPVPAPAGIAPDAPEKITRPLAIRIAVAIAVLTVSTLLLYNVRSR